MLRILKFIAYRRLSCGSINHQKTFRKFRTARYNLTNGTKLLIGTNICCSILKSETSKRMATEEDIHKALEEGDTAIIKLMDQLKEFVQIISEEYRKALNKQIEITEAASNVGPLSEMWDELPKHRTWADELLKEINECSAVFNTIGQLAKEKVLAKFVLSDKDNLDMVAVKYKELEEVMQHELEQNKKLEIKLVQAHCDSILTEISDMQNVKETKEEPPDPLP